MLCAVWTSSFSTTEWARCLCEARPSSLAKFLHDDVLPLAGVHSVVCFYVYLIAYILGSVVLSHYGHNVGGFIQHMTKPSSSNCLCQINHKRRRKSSLIWQLSRLVNHRVLHVLRCYHYWDLPGPAPSTFSAVHPVVQKWKADTVVEASSMRPMRDVGMCRSAL